MTLLGITTQLQEGVDPGFFYLVGLGVYFHDCMLLYLCIFIACFIALDFSLLLTPFWISYFAVVRVG